MSTQYTSVSQEAAPNTTIAGPSVALRPRPAQSSINAGVGLSAKAAARAERRPNRANSRYLCSRLVNGRFLFSKPGSLIYRSFQQDAKALEQGSGHGPRLSKIFTHSLLNCKMRPKDSQSRETSSDTARETKEKKGCRIRFTGENSDHYHIKKLFDAGVLYQAEWCLAY